MDSPTTYVIPQRSYDLEFRFGAEGGMIGRVGVSPFERFAFGISYGGEKVLGTGNPEWHPSPAIQAKLGIATPKLSFAIGFDSEEYKNSAKGVYGVAGGDLGGKFIPYLGINYYKEKLSAWCGGEAGLSREASLLFEGHFRDMEFTINAGMRWIFEERIMIELDFKNLLNGEIIRVLKFSYMDYI